MGSDWRFEHIMSPIVGNTSSEGKKPDAPTIYSATATGSDVSLDIQPGSWNGKGSYTFTIVDTDGTYYPGMTYMGTPITLYGFQAGTSLQFYAYTVTDYGVDGNMSNYSDPVTFQALAANYVISAQDGNLYYSTNLANWSQASGVPSFNSGFYVNSTFYVSSGSGTGGYSTDGMNWTTYSHPAFDYSTRIGYGNGKFVSRGYGQNLNVSTDFINWTSVTAPNNYLYYQATNRPPFYVGGKWYTTEPGSKLLEISTNGTTWSSTTVNAPKMPLSGYWALTYFGSYFYGLNASYDAQAGRLFRSTDAVTWSEVTLPSPYPNMDLSNESLSSGNGRIFINGGSWGGFITSTNGTTWTTVTVPGNFAPLNKKITYGTAGKWVGLNNDYSGPINVLSSTNGTSFSLGTDLNTSMPTVLDGSGNPMTFTFGDITYGNKYVVSAYAQDWSGWPAVSKTIFRSSTDAVTWTGWTSAISRNGNQFGGRIYYANGVFATSANDAWNDSQNVLISSNATSWTKVVGPSNTSYGTIAAAVNNTFIWAGLDSIIHTSTNGSTWTQRSTQISGYWASWAYGNSRYMTADFYGSPKLSYSTNLTTWSATSYSGQMLPSPDAENSNYRIASSGSVAVFVPNNPTPASSGAVIRSTDLVTFTTSDLTIGGWTWASGVAYGNGVFVFGQDYVGIHVSTNGTNWSTYSFPDGSNRPDTVDFSGTEFKATGPGYGSTIYTSTDGISWTANYAMGGNPWYGDEFPQTRVVGKI